MNYRIKYILIIVLLLFQNTKIAAQDKKLNCNDNLKDAIQLLQKENYTEQDSKEAIKLLKPVPKKEMLILNYF